MKRDPLKDRLRYRFDSFMAGGGRSVFVSLVIVFLGILVFTSTLRGAFLHYLPNSSVQHGFDFFRNVYITFLEMTDPGNMAQDIRSSLWFKFTGIIAGIAGVIIFSALIALITTALDRKLQQLRKGHSRVIEEGHTLIIGWNAQRVLEILRELILANESEDDPCVVILSEVDKEEMDDYLAVNLRDSKNTRIVTRSGRVSSTVNLKLVAADEAKSAIVLASCFETSEEKEKASSDAMVIKTLLALITGRATTNPINLVAEIFDATNRRVAEELAPGEITTIDAREILSKILVQTSRSTGLSVVYSEILSFDGCEMYFYGGDFANSTFGEIAYRFQDGIPMGIAHEGGILSINPAAENRLVKGDKLLLLARDDSAIALEKKPVTHGLDLPRSDLRYHPKVEKELILGWTPSTDLVLKEFAEYLPEGSSIDIVVPVAFLEMRNRIRLLQDDLPSLRLQIIETDPMDRECLMRLDPASYDNIMILSMAAKLSDSERRDSETIVLLLMLRGIFNQEAANRKKPKLITEVLDTENDTLIAHAGVNDFIISNRFISMILAQMSENNAIKGVLDNLFSEQGSEIYLKPASFYMTDFSIDVSFADLMILAQKRGETCLGVKLKELETQIDKNFGVVLNPNKKQRYSLSAEDCLVVLANDET